MLGVIKSSGAQENASDSISFQKILILLSLPLLIWLLWKLQLVIALALLSLLLAVGLAPIVTSLERHHFPRFLAITTVFVGILAPVVGILLGAGRIAMAEGQAVVAQIPNFLARWRELAAGNPLLAPPEAAYGLIPSNSLHIAGNSIVIPAFGLLVLVITYYLLVDREMLWNVALNVTPLQHRRMIDLLGGEIADRSRGYFRGVVITAVTIGVATWLGLLMLGIPYALFFGVLAGVLEVIPLIGPVLAAVGPILLALGQSPLHAGLVLIFFIVLQQVEDKVLVVRIQASTTGLHPLTVLFSMLVMGVLFGLAGVILAIPVAAAIQASAICLTSCFLHPRGQQAWLSEREQSLRRPEEAKEVNRDQSKGAIE